MTSAAVSEKDLVVLPAQQKVTLGKRGVNECVKHVGFWSPDIGVHYRCRRALKATAVSSACTATVLGGLSWAHIFADPSILSGIASMAGGLPVLPFAVLFVGVGGSVVAFLVVKYGTKKGVKDLAWEYGDLSRQIDILESKVEGLQKEKIGFQYEQQLALDTAKALITEDLAHENAQIRIKSRSGKTESDQTRAKKLEGYLDVLVGNKPIPASMLREYPDLLEAQRLEKKASKITARIEMFQARIGALETKKKAVSLAYPRNENYDDDLDSSQTNSVWSSEDSEYSEYEDPTDWFISKGPNGVDGGEEDVFAQLCDLDQKLDELESKLYDPKSKLGEVEKKALQEQIKTVKIQLCQQVDDCFGSDSYNSERVEELIEEMSQKRELLQDLQVALDQARKSEQENLVSFSVSWLFSSGSEEERQIEALQTDANNLRVELEELLMGEYDLGDEERENSNV